MTATLPDGLPYRVPMFGRRKRTEPSPIDPSPGPDMRRAVLTLDPSEVGLDRSHGEVWGTVMDASTADGGWYSLVCLADGTTSLYTSSTFGVIGAGQWPHIAQASTAFLQQVAESLELFEPARTHELPPPLFVALRALTWQGERWVVAPEEDLVDERHAASPLFHAAHDVIGLIRMTVGSREGP